MPHAPITDVVFDMETQDPDDFLCLLFLASHPRVNLKAVTITPGSREQIGIVRWALRTLSLDGLPVGAVARHLDHGPAHRFQLLHLRL
jgi:inosine-uridine nucleoside N-ribohydrolase